MIRSEYREYGTNVVKIRDSYKGDKISHPQSSFENTMLTPTNEESRFKHPIASEEKNPIQSRNHEFSRPQMNTHDEFATKEAQACKSSFSGEGFSDIDLADIADEDFTNEKPVEVGNGLVRDNIAIAPTGPSTAGKYTTTNSKNVAASLELMNKTSTQQLKKQNTFNFNMQTESNIIVETAKEIMQKKGSKCKCPKEYSANSIERKPVCGNYCKYLSGRQ